MGGFVFFQTEAREQVVEFYRDRLDAGVWLVDPDLTVLSFDGFRFGFVDREPAETDGTLTFLVPHRTGVDDLHEALADMAMAQPAHQQTRAVYGFVAHDPEHRTVRVRTLL